MEEGKKELRKSREEIKKEFQEYKKVKNLDIFVLKDLLSHCNVVPEIIKSYLEILQKENKNSFLEEICFYYPIPSIEVCKNFGVKKTKTEKDRFFELVTNLSSIEPPDEQEKIKSLLVKEIKSYDELKSLIPEECFEEEKKEKDSDPLKYSRWLKAYNTSIDYKTEENEEYLFYNLSNNLISEFLKSQNCFHKRMELIINIIDIFEELYSRKKEEKKFCDHFEFLCLALTNCEKNLNYERLNFIIDSIEKEITLKFMNIDEIKAYLTQKKYHYECDDRKIIIHNKGRKFVIDDYSLYNLNEDIIELMIGEKRLSYKNFLEQNMKFSEHLLKMKKSNDLLIKIIKKFSSSNLAYSSIQKSFNIKKEEYKELFKELSDNIEKYIFIMPYNCFLDTERTFKNPMKIIIDPYKDKYFLNIRIIGNNIELQEALKDFCNIGFRKFSFEHEIHHLITALLFFLYINDESNLNSLYKEVTPEGDIKSHHELVVQDLIKIKNKNIQKEAGNIFELLCYGEIQKQFTLKQLLFIVNECNDNLDYVSFKKKYESHCKKNLDELLNQFPDDQPLSNHVKKIKEFLTKTLKGKETSIEEVLGDKFIVSKEESDDDDRDCYSILNDEETVLVEEYERYDNKLFFEKRIKYKIPKKSG